MEEIKEPVETETVPTTDENPVEEVQEEQAPTVDPMADTLNTILKIVQDLTMDMSNLKQVLSTTDQGVITPDEQEVVNEEEDYYDDLAGNLGV